MAKTLTQKSMSSKKKTQKQFGNIDLDKNNSDNFFSMNSSVMFGQTFSAAAFANITFNNTNSIRTVKDRTNPFNNIRA